MCLPRVCSGTVFLFLPRSPPTRHRRATTNRLQYPNPPDPHTPTPLTVPSLAKFSTLNLASPLLSPGWPISWGTPHPKRALFSSRNCHRKAIFQFIWRMVLPSTTRRKGTRTGSPRGVKPAIPVTPRKLTSSRGIRPSFPSNLAKSARAAS